MRTVLDEMIETGVIQLGEPVAPYTLQRFKVSNTGELVTYNVVIEGRKTPLIDIRNYMLQQEQYMHLLTDSDIASMTEDDMRALLKRNHMTTELTNKKDMQQCIAIMQRNRMLVCWHDHAKILGTGYLLITINTVYDTAQFMTEQEYKVKTGKDVSNIQAIVEKPHIYIIAAGSSSAEDQAAVIPDRTECLHDLTQVCISSKGIGITDTLRFFKGDGPAKQFERGTQMGGNYKCGSCGCHSDMMGDLAHAFQLKWRSLLHLQTLAFAGRHGGQPNVLNPLRH